MTSRRWTVFTVAAISLAALVWFGWSRRTSAVQPSSGAIVVAITPFRATGTQMEPWSGLGLAQSLQSALDGAGDWTARVVQSGDAGDAGGARYLLGGTLGRQGPRREIGVELLRLPERRVLWSGTFWRTESDLASFTSELAAAVADAIRLDSGTDR